MPNKSKQYINAFCNILMIIGLIGLIVVFVIFGIILAIKMILPLYNTILILWPYFAVVFTLCSIGIGGQILLTPKTKLKV